MVSDAGFLEDLISGVVAAREELGITLERLKRARDEIAAGRKLSECTYDELRRELKKAS